MIGKASEIKVHKLDWWPSFEPLKPDIDQLLQQWLNKYPELDVVQITFDLTPTHKQVIILYKYGERS